MTARSTENMENENNKKFIFSRYIPYIHKYDNYVYNVKFRHYRKNLNLDGIDICDNILEIAETPDGEEQNITKLLNNKKSGKKEEKIDEKIIHDEKKQHLSADEFWMLVKKMKWADIDETIITYDLFKNSLPKSDLITLIYEINTIYGEKIFECIRNLDGIFGFEYNRTKNIAFHIVLKGRDFYEGVLNTPNISLYLINNCQSVLEYFNLICNI
jgi:hypothetical protein